MPLIEIRCHSCDRCLGEVSETATGTLSMKCHKCRHQNHYIMPEVTPRKGRARRGASMKKVVASR